MKRLSFLCIAATLGFVVTCSKAPTGPEGNTGNSLTLTTTPSTLIGTVIRIPDKAAYKQGDTIKLVATPQEGYVFTGWSGDTASNVDTLIVILMANKTVLANFKSNSGKSVFSFETSAQNGIIILSPSGGVYDSGISVIVKIKPDYGFQLTGKSGDFSGTDTLDTIVVTKNLTLTALFSENPQAVFYTVIVNPQPVNGKISITPKGIETSNGYKYQPSTLVTFQAIPDSSCKFVEWGGDLADYKKASVDALLDKNIVITAVFDKGSSLPSLAGTWKITNGVYIRGGVYGVFAYESGDSLVLGSDSTYVSHIHKMASVNNQCFCGTGSGKWSADSENIFFGYSLGGPFEYTISGNLMTMTNGELTIDAVRMHP